MSFKQFFIQKLSLFFMLSPLTWIMPADKMPVISYESVEAGIKAAMPSQRVRGAENRAGNKPPNGPRRAQSKACPAEYSAT